MGALEPGKEFGAYKLVNRLARGGMGEIWLAERQGISGFSKRVVVKTILEHFADEPELVEMFLQEGKVAAGLNHQNIAQTLDLGQVGEIYYIAMEYIHGRDLRDLLLASYARKQLIPLNLILRIGADCCQGLYHAHSWKTPDGQPAGIVHRDISPQNILVSFDGGVKIVDFGIARAMHSASKTRSGVLKGKYAYMSPEQVEGEALDGRADVFSLGVVMYEMVTGRRLFKRDSEVATLDAVLKTYVPPPSKLDRTVPGPVEDVILKALRRDREKRYSDAREFQLTLEEIIHGEGLPASSAHLSAYMHDLFQEDSEPAQDKVSRLEKGMNSLPDVKKENAPVLERTISYIPADLGGQTDSTKNLLGSRRPGKRPALPWRLLLAIFLLALVGTAGWYLFSTLLSEKSAPTQSPDAAALAAAEPVPPNAGAPVIETRLVDAGMPDAGVIVEESKAAPDAGAVVKPRPGGGGKKPKPRQPEDQPPDIKTER